MFTSPSFLRDFAPTRFSLEPQIVRHLEKPELKQILEDPHLQGLEVLVLFFAPSPSSQTAGKSFVARLEERKDWEPIAGPEVAQAQLEAFRAWERGNGDRFAKLLNITQPCLVDLVESL